MHHARPGPRCCLVAWLLGLWLAAWPGLVQAAYSCNVVAQRVNLLAEVFAAQTVVQSLTVTCSRAPGDASTLTYRIVAGDGNHLNGAQRRVRRELTINNFLNYGLVRATAAGAAPTCSATTNWRGTGANVISGTLNFGTALSQSVTWNYCVRAAASSFANAGIYTDSVLLTLRYPNTGAGQLNTAPLDIQVGVQTSCLLDKPLPGLTVAYTSLQSMAAILNTSVLLRCSTGHPWTAGLLPPSLQRRIFPVRGQMLLYRPAEPFPGSVLLSPGGYVIPRADGLLLAGSTVETGIEDSIPTVQAFAQLKAMAEQLWPALRGVTPLAQWAGIRPGSTQPLPLIGEVPGSNGLVWVNSGHFRNGLVCAPASAALVADLLCGLVPDIDPAPYSVSGSSSSPP